MAANPMVERLTPLDVLMPRTYATMLLTFHTTEAMSAVSQALQRGLENLFNQLPWLSGRVVPATQAQGQRPTLEILRTSNESPTSLIDEGSISAAYERACLLRACLQQLFHPSSGQHQHDRRFSLLKRSACFCCEHFPFWRQPRSGTELAVADLPDFFDRASGKLLAAVCDNISRSQSSARINSRYIAEVYSLANHIDDYRTIFPGWDLFGSRDLTITSWIDLGLYGLDFGTALGKPDFIRVRCTEADGVGIILPRRRAPDEVIDVMLMLRRDDMEALDQTSMWTALVKCEMRVCDRIPFYGSNRSRHRSFIVHTGIPSSGRSVEYFA